ncbi:type I restriction endonuclease subunit R [Pseudohalioglobus sediminis]|uniref:Type I restriction endonuclease subunit R n=1 Tax=Pseudohalioglobus sediminis TaxID=2606449 RepID=A0A5B0WTQ3_9GAMM|nr:type I restriction endonuclease [Pseudohalioglobus sediminis]KAA1189259.1 type I restriction endonuclease subunit R [Pseudohalioglobus sediminis]
MADAKEAQFQQDIIDSLTANGWLLGSSDQYDRELAIFPEDLIGYVKDTQPDQWDKLAKHFPDSTNEALLKTAAKWLDKQGTLWVLRNAFKDRGARFRLCTFKPDHDLNPELTERYHKNRLRVVPELVYSPHGYEGRLDLTLFVNGLPVATLELKSEFKQALDNAKYQYIKDRQPRDPTTKKAEPLLTFKRGALVHFAVSQMEVAMTTKLAGMKTYFLPFNRGTADGGAGNDLPEQGYPTAYLWEEIFQPDNFLNIVGRYLHLEVKTDEDALGKKTTKETMIFPRYHQWDAVRSLLGTTVAEGPGEKYLVQHSAGSGKSNSIAWLSHQLSALHRPDGDKLFNSIIVITDRTVLDSQLQETIYQFEHAEGVVARINREEGDGSKSEQLASALAAGTPIIIVTIQTFPYVLQAIQESAGLKERTFAVIADEAHSSQTGATARKLREVLMAELLDDDAEITAEDILDATLAARSGSENISYYAFTATPKAKTLELFGRCPNPSAPPSDENAPAAFHIYSMRQAIEEGFILDVLQNYTNYNTAYKLAHANPDLDEDVEKKKAATEIAKWVRLHPHNIAQKVEIIVEHFRTRVAHLLNGEAKAMVVTGSRKEAVRYKLAMDKYVSKKAYENINAMVAFSGEVVDKDSGPEPFTERNMNPGLKGRDMRDAFDTHDYQVMIVANKFQTGFDQPKLVAMYVDKKLAGVDCVQTLSRLNRTHPGKDQTFVLDFVNEPEGVLEEFQKYYQTAELAAVSDPNLVYDLMESLKDERIFQWSEVESFAAAYFDPKAAQAALIAACKPAVDRYGARYTDAMDALKLAQNALKDALATGNDSAIKHAEHSLSQAKEAKDILDTFKKNLRSFSRFYEFISQVVDFNDDELEKLNVYAAHLAPLLREEVVREQVDLSQVVMTHYKLNEVRQQRLVMDKKGGYLEGATSIGGHTPKEQEYDKLAAILERVNDLFAGEHLTDKDKVNWLNSLKDKVAENEAVMDQISRNTKEQAMLGDYPAAVESAVIGSMEAHSDLAMQFLSDKQISSAVAEALLALLTSNADTAS